MGGHTTGVLLGTTLVGTTLVWSQRSLEADGEWAAGLMGQRGKPSRRREGARAGAPGGRIAFVPGRGKAAARRWPMWPPCRAVPCRSAPFCVAQPAGRLGRSMCSCSRHLAGSRSAGDVNQAGRKALDSSDKSSPARRAKAEEARRRRCCCCEQGRMAGDSEQRLEEHGQPSGGEPFLIGVSGGTASGKVRGAGGELRGGVRGEPRWGGMER